MGLVATACDRLRRAVKSVKDSAVETSSNKRVAAPEFRPREIDPLQSGSRLAAEISSVVPNSKTD
ncbi:hypothetical protein N7478_005425 [Penicillium angulare]|uniref:uncharacterized protein n=1 Tax=Penicillium angulare TaxID=116970 RepID=UPI0025414902|nr:uncharacterized protein N7478_005425 [Penicillium angulare]KAJ5280053.1 hypothetical protein N7478_005425 [Penicillium angulare]